MGLLRAIRLLTAGVLLGTAGFALSAQTSRIATGIDSSQRTSLANNVSPRATLAVDLGPVAPDRQITGMALRFSMTAAQQQALAQLLLDQQDPASPRYQQWLTPEQFKAQFGLSAGDTAKVTAWLAAQGFSVSEIARSGTFVRFSGSAGQVRQAFGTEIHQVTSHGEQHIANLAAPTLPVALASVTAAISGLDDFRPHTHHSEGTDPAQVSVPTAKLQPEYTSTATGNHYIAPGDFYTIYGESGLISSGVTGTGVTVAVVGQTDINLSDIAAFRSAAGLAASTPTVKLYGTDPGNTSSGDLTESELGLEWAGATAPGASILYVNSVDAIDGSLTEAIDNNVAPIISVTYGECEPDLGVSKLAYYSQLLQMAAAEGITIAAASGDDGATDCDYQTASATQGLAVDFPASSPLVTGVGGTEFNEGAGTYWSATNSTTGASATGYIPEVVWNDDGSGGLYASGGGRSVYFAKPAWQTGAGVPADFSRDVPDVSLSASPVHDPYLICISGCTNGFLNSSGNIEYIGGTSLGAPSFAGLLALVEQKTGGRLGNANPTIYALANSTYAGNVFHDVVSGTNASPCTAGTTGCPAGGTIGFSATANYDLATGWGSVNAMNLVNDWPLVKPVATTTGNTPSQTNVAGSANSVAVGTTINLTATVASAVSTSATTPTGSVQFTVDNVAVGSAVVLSSGTASYALNTAGLASGAHTVGATYLGDTTYAGSKGAFAITITAANGADFTLTPATANVAVAAGGTAQGLTFTVAAVNGFTGNVQFSASAPSMLSAQYSFSVNPVAITSSSATGTTTLTLFAYTSQAKTAALLTEHKRRVEFYGAGSGVALAGMLLLLLPGNRRKRLPALLVLLLAAGTIGLSGCSGTTIGSGGGPVNTPTPKGSYAVIVSGTATINGVATSHSSTVTFVVQ